MIKVTPETYIRAESDRSFHNILAIAGGVNRFHHIRKPTLLDQQTIIRMNRDTLYSGAVIDTSKGASITLPKVPAGRFISAQVVDNDHYCPAVFYEPGNQPLPNDTKYVLLIVRIQLFDANDLAEVALVNALQDELVIEAGGADPMPPLQWEPESLKALTAEYDAEAKKLPNYRGLMGPRGTVDEFEAASRRRRRLGPQSREGRDLPQLRRSARSEQMLCDDLQGSGEQCLQVDHGLRRGRLSEIRLQHRQQLQREAERRRDVHRVLRLEGALRRQTEPPRRHAWLEFSHAHLSSGPERPRRKLLPARGEPGRLEDRL